MMSLTKEDLQSIVLLLNDGLAPITKELQVMKSEMFTMKSNMVTKEELIKELKGLATKEELKSLAGKEDLDRLKDDVHFVLEELIKTEKWIGKIDDRVDNLNDKVDTLLLQSDNTALLLKLHNQQTGEIREIKSRVEVLEMKLA